ncbi:MAG: beta-lactamase family protein [Bradyrhizobium sp.]|nr:beta-lactamase family protein [Bradyrhizobium sp.]
MIPPLVVDRALPPEMKANGVADWLDEIYRRNLFSGAVLVAKVGNICFEGQYGYADLADSAPLTRHSSFSIASLSKQFTATAMLMLAHAGRLKLDDAMARYLPELNVYGGITIKQMLHHTSGLPDYMAVADKHWDGTRVITAIDVVKMLEQFRPPPVFRPGDEFQYNNTGYALLEVILSRATGLTYPDFMKQEVFDRLGMNDSAAFNLASRECPLRSRVFGFRKSFFGKKVLSDLNYLDGVYGDGGIYSSTSDLARWDAALRYGTLLPVSVYDRAYVSGKLNSGANTGYGYGWETISPNVVEHWGNWEGFTAHIRRDLRGHLLLVVLSNFTPYHDAISNELWDAYSDGAWA